MAAFSCSSAASNHYTASTIEIFTTVTPAIHWSEGDVKAWLESVGFDDLARVSEEHGIDGVVLQNLDFETLKDLGLAKVGRKLRLMRLINELKGFRLPSEDIDKLQNLRDTGNRQLDVENDLWNAFNNQNDRIRLLEEQLWEFKELMQTLKERTDGLDTFNSSWDVRPCANPLNFPAKPSVDSSTSTPPTTASPSSAAVTPLTRGQEQDQSSQVTDSIPLISPTNLEQTRMRRRSCSPHDYTNHSDYDISTSESELKTSQTSFSPQTGTSTLDEGAAATGGPHNPSLSNPWSRKQSSTNTHELKRQSSYGFADLHRKHSVSKLEGTPVQAGPNTSHPTQVYSKPNAAPVATGMMVARKPSLLTRRAHSPMLGIGSTFVRNGVPPGETRVATQGVWATSSRNLIAPASGRGDPISPNNPSPKSLMNPRSHALINRSASTSNLRTALHNPSPKTSPNFQQKTAETSVRVKSNNEQTVIEVLSNHLSTFHMNEPHAWSKHVLLLRVGNTKEYCLSYDEIPLKVYRSFKSREGVDFAIRSIDEIPSPLRLTGSGRKRDHGFNLEEELAMSDDLMSSDDSRKAVSQTKTESERNPLAYGLAICGYQAEKSDELSIKAGESFKIKSHSQGRYLLERETHLFSPSPHSVVASASASSSVSPKGLVPSTYNENGGWVAENCILESSQSLRLLASNGSSLKHLISNAMEGATEYLDLPRLTTDKVCLIPFQSHSITWSGELTNVQQGELLKAFNFKTRLHWTYCLRESNGERGWIPNWILSSNLHVLPETPHLALKSLNKLQMYLLHQSSVQPPSNANKFMPSSNPLISHLAITQDKMLNRSASSATYARKLTKATLSPASLRGVRTQKPGSAHAASPPNNGFVRQPAITKKVDSAAQTSEQSPTQVASLNRSVTDGARSKNFTPRSRRSRINPIMEA